MKGFPLLPPESCPRQRSDPGESLQSVDVGSQPPRCTRHNNPCMSQGRLRDRGIQESISQFAPVLAFLNSFRSCERSPTVIFEPLLDKVAKCLYRQIDTIGNRFPVIC